MDLERALKNLEERKRLTEKGKKELEQVFSLLQKKLSGENLTLLSNKHVPLKWAHWTGETHIYGDTSHPDSPGVKIGTIDGVVGLWEPSDYYGMDRFIPTYEITYISWPRLAESLQDFIDQLANLPLPTEEVNKLEQIRKILEK